MLDLAYTAQFKKDVKCKKRQGADLRKLDRLITRLRKRETLDEKLRDHELSGNWRGHRECHIEPDWLLIYKIEKDELILTAVRTGSHSELFNL